MLRRRFDAEGKVINGLEEYPEAMRQTAAEEGVPLIDLSAMSKSFHESLGPENSKKAFLHYAAGTFAEQPEPLKDDTHFSAYGGHELAKCVVEGIRSARLGLVRYLVKGLPVFDPSRPGAFENWSLPLSPPQPSFSTPTGRLYGIPQWPMRTPETGFSKPSLGHEGKTVMDGRSAPLFLYHF